MTLISPKDVPSNSRKGFTFVELLVVVAVIVVMAGMVIPALGASKSRSVAAGCLANLRQLQNAWAMYLDDNNDVMLPNAPASGANSEAWCPTGSESWSGSPPIIDVNTNVSIYTNTLIWPYISSNITVLKCPADVLPALDGPRLRSYSMNGAMGAVYLSGEGVDAYSSGFLTYVYGSDLTCPTPANAFIFLDEHPDSINDGYLEINSSPNGGFPDIPASYIEGGCGFSFADGHCVIHQWQTTNLMIPAAYTTIHYAEGGASNPDWVWFTSHATCPE